MAENNKTNKYVLEAARAAVLATHAAAGLATSASSREVARLLRSAEALWISRGHLVDPKYDTFVKRPSSRSRCSGCSWWRWWRRAGRPPTTAAAESPPYQTKGHG